MHGAIDIVCNLFTEREVKEGRTGIDDRFLDQYLEAAGPDLTETVGCYRLEGLGAHLFERIDGDHSTILGLPLLPVLTALRALKALAA